MKKLLILSGIILLSRPVHGADVKVSAPEDHRFPLHFAQEMPVKKGLLEKILLAGKGLGAGAAGTLFGAFCYQNARFDIKSDFKDASVLNRVSALCAAGGAFVCAAKLGSYSIQCVKAVLAD